MIVSFAMPGWDEQSSLDERTDSYLAAETSLNLSQGFQGILFIWLSLKDSQVPHFPPSFSNPPSGFICLKITQEETTLLLLNTQTKWSGNCTRKPIHLLSFSSAVNRIYYAVHPAPCFCQEACGVKYGWGGRPGSQTGGDCLCSSISRSSKHIYYRVRVGHSWNSGRGEGKCRCWTEVTLHPTSPWLYHFTLHLNQKARRGPNSEEPRPHFLELKEDILEGSPIFKGTVEVHPWPVLMCQYLGKWLLDKRKQCRVVSTFFGSRRGCGAILYFTSWEWLWSSCPWRVDDWHGSLSASMILLS